MTRIRTGNVSGRADEATFFLRSFVMIEVKAGMKVSQGPVKAAEPPRLMLTDTMLYLPLRFHLKIRSSPFTRSVVK